METRVFWIAVMAGIGATMLGAGVALAEDKTLFDYEERAQCRRMPVRRRPADGRWPRRACVRLSGVGGRRTCW